ncbi:hypothetical protein DYB39_09065 [Providencia rettgeri]|uniref:hypothetical protein n=1 Tax=Providencia rettgeri TaxID=587 RepID=UPI000E3D196B|nr:hypothetical protein DYB39_09065 [Providencia rettgeri]
MKKWKNNLKVKCSGIVSIFFVWVLPPVYAIISMILIMNLGIDQDGLKIKFGGMFFVWVAICAFFIGKFCSFAYEKCSNNVLEDIFLMLMIGSEIITLFSISLEIYSNDMSTGQTASIPMILLVMVLGFLIITHLHKGKSSDAQAIKELAKTASETYVKFEKLKDEMDSIIKNNKSIDGLITEISKEINSNNNDLDRVAIKINEILISCNKLMSDDKNIQ